MSEANQSALPPPNSPAEFFELLTMTHQNGIEEVDDEDRQHDLQRDLSRRPAGAALDAGCAARWRS